MTTRYQSLCAALETESRKWLVTGAAGFIGSALVEQLLKLGQTVVGLDNFETGRQQNLDDVCKLVGEKAAARFQFIEGDIRNLEDCATAASGCQYVLHQAALGSVPRSIENPLATHKANVDGFVHMLIAARDAGVDRFVYASSSSVYGDHPALPKVEEAFGEPLSPYAATKRINEVYAAVWQKSYGTEIIGLRYFNVYGRRQDPNGPYAAVIPRWLDSLASGKPCLVFGDGSQSRDFCYIDNAVQANLLAATSDAESTGQVYNVGCAGRTSLLELYQMLRAGVAEQIPAAASLEPKHQDPRPGDVPHSQASIDKAREKLGYQPSHEIDQGIAETVGWYLSQR